MSTAMTPFAQRVLANVMCNFSSKDPAVRRQKAEAFLDAYNANWRNEGMPEATRHMVQVSKEEEDE